MNWKKLTRSQNFFIWKENSLLLCNECPTRSRYDINLNRNCSLYCSNMSKLFKFNYYYEWSEINLFSSSLLFVANIMKWIVIFKSGRFVCFFKHQTGHEINDANGHWIHHSEGVNCTKPPFNWYSTIHFDLMHVKVWPRLFFPIIHNWWFDTQNGNAFDLKLGIDRGYLYSNKALESHWRQKRHALKALKWQWISGCFWSKSFEKSTTSNEIYLCVCCAFENIWTERR